MQPFHPPQPRHLDLPATPDSPAYEKESHFGSEQASRQARESADGAVRLYEEKQDSVGKGLDASISLIADLRNFNKDRAVRFPSLRSADGAEEAAPSRPGIGRRNKTVLSFADQPSSLIPVNFTSTQTARGTPKRSLTSRAAPPMVSSEPCEPLAGDPIHTEPHAEEDEDDFSILRLDLNMGTARHARTLISHLEKTSISALLDTRFADALDHMALLQKRIYDPQSRVLVTGDLNAGKSTLINALLRRNEVMPTDEQPLTTRFVEVVSARENNNREEIHVLDRIAKYDPADQSTYTVESVEKLEQMVTDMETDASSPPVRVFLRDVADLVNPSILHNGVVDISLIDAPGLNRDSIKTTANFARQEEIDVVVFVVSAANHFTLSAKEFIWQAGQEKAHLFIVVNRYDTIKDKARCRRLVLEQIRQLSPKTYEDAADLVHFVDSAKVALGFSDDEPADDVDEAFSHLEQSLRSFVLVNRSKSKLGPAQNYVNHLLADVELLSAANLLVATNERDAARAEIARVKPVLEKMKKSKEGLEESLLGEEESLTEQSSSRTKKAMERALERVGRGEMAAPTTELVMPAYTGLLGVWDYAAETKRVFLASLDFAVSLAEQDARRLTADGVARVTELGSQYLPADVERSKRVFNPNAMFSPRPSSSRRQSGVAAVGLGLAAQSQLTDVNVSDIFDLQHHVFLFRSQLPTAASSSSPPHEIVPFSTEMSGLGIASLAVGAFSMVGSKALGVRSVIEGAVRLSELASNPAARRWAGPIVGAMVIGAVAYVIYDLPYSIPRNVGRHLQATLSVSSGTSGDAEIVPFDEAVGARVSKEVRKVLRLASWDLRERYRTAVEARGEVVRESEEMERSAIKALEFFSQAGDRVEEVREMMPSKI